MSEHVTEWLNAYLDGELHGTHLQQVEEHLSKCEVCRAELRELQKLSRLLQDTVPTRAFVPTERFVTNLTLSLPRRPEVRQGRRATELAWWLVPAAVLGLWIFSQTVSVVSALFSTANAAGLFGNTVAWLQGSLQHTGWFSATMSLYGSTLTGNTRALLALLDNLNVFGWSLAAQLMWQVGIGLLYWVWLAIWWTRRQQAVTAPSSL